MFSFFLIALGTLTAKASAQDKGSDEKPTVYLGFSMGQRVLADSEKDRSFLTANASTQFYSITFYPLGWDLGLRFGRYSTRAETDKTVESRQKLLAHCAGLSFRFYPGGSKNFHVNLDLDAGRGSITQTIRDDFQIFEEEEDVVLKAGHLQIYFSPAGVLWFSAGVGYIQSPYEMEDLRISQTEPQVHYHFGLHLGV